METNTPVWVSILLNIIPLIIIIAIVVFFLIRRKVTVYMISAVKPDFLDIIEMHVSTNRSEIDEWEKTFWSRGYHVSRKTDEVKFRRFKSFSG